jgi:prepilin peptidase CpaA
VTTAIKTVVSLALILAAFKDFKSYRIPNWLVLTVAFLAILNSACLGSLAYLGWREALISLALGIVLFRLKLLGGGDVKLISANMLWFPGDMSSFYLLTALLGGFIAILILILKKAKVTTTTLVPYGVAIGGSSLILLWQTLIWSKP